MYYKLIKENLNLINFILKSNKFFIILIFNPDTFYLWDNPDIYIEFLTVYTLYMKNAQ